MGKSSVLIGIINEIIGWMKRHQILARVGAASAVILGLVGGISGVTGQGVWPFMQQTWSRLTYHAATPETTSTLPSSTPIGATTYITNEPGSKCDNQGAIWSSPTDAQIQCNSNGMLLTLKNPESVPPGAEMLFRWPAHPFMTTYTVG
jgi:hypothetical protein